MTNLLRTMAPPHLPVPDMLFIEPEVFELRNGLKVYGFKGSTEQILKTELVMDAGSLLDNSWLIPVTASDLLFTGSGGKTSEQIASELDYFGSFNSKHCHYTDNSITNFCLNNYTGEVYGLLSQYISAAEFYKTELDTYKFIKTQNLNISKLKTAYLARKNFSKAVFGAHPYGFYPDVEDYQAITQEQVTDFYNGHKKFKYIILAGDYNDSTIANLDKYFGDFEVRGSWIYNDKIKGESQKNIQVPLEKSVQCTVRVGFQTINRLEEDYQRLGILVTLLGGFFGSRLMKNIREEKGYTYGIHASLTSYPDAGLLSIQTDVNKEVYEDTVNEIFKEINRLKNEPISNEEIMILSNYSLGSFLRSIDGAFAISEKYKTLLDFGQDYNYYHNYIRLLKNLDTEELMEVARKYFVEDEIYTVVAGV